VKLGGVDEGSVVDKVQKRTYI